MLKEILGIGDSLSGSLLLYDSLSATFQKVLVKPDPECPLCGPKATIVDLSIHAGEAEARDA